MKNYQGAILILLIGFAISFLLAYGFQNMVYGPANPQGPTVNFQINAGESLESVGQRLEEEGIIKNKDIFVLFGILNGMEKQLREGEYLLSPQNNLLDVIKELQRGNSQPSKVLTIKEGETLEQIQSYLEQDFNASYEIDKIKAGEWSKEFPCLENISPDDSLEGYLFPDTYYFSQSATVEDVIRKILFNFQKKIGPIEKEIEARGSLSRTIIMASLVEKEVPHLEDKKIVAGIIEKRMEIGMPIQIDATINYILQKTSPLSINDTQVDSPYNTYQHLGLPLGPICNPGLESIQAVLAPKDSSYLYYLTTPQREVIYSRTLLEHNRAKAKYYPKK